jgi:hypothetical protein
VSLLDGMDAARLPLALAPLEGDRDLPRDLARDLGVSETAASVLVQRGFPDRESAARFFDPRLANLSPRLR